MRKKIYILFFIHLIVSSDVAFGKNNSKSKLAKDTNKKHNNVKEKSSINRIKRSLDDDDFDGPFWPNRGKKRPDTDQNYYNIKYNSNQDANDKILKTKSSLDIEEPFWGTRGRRDSSSVENYLDMEYPLFEPNLNNMDKICKECDNSKNKNKFGYEYLVSRNNHYKQLSEKNDDFPFWANRGKRQENDPFWGTRGRREDETPFWGNRGRRQDPEPFWGARGRRDDVEPFWGNRGRRHDIEPFWRNRGSHDTEPFWGSRGRRKQDLKESYLHSINNVEENIDNIPILRQSNKNPMSFWSNTGRNSRLKYLYSGPPRKRLPLTSKAKPDLKFKPTELRSVQDDRIYAEQPHYIIVERSSRSSSEDDPFFISRGKKEVFSIEPSKIGRGRRGAIEQIVKSVQNDPYFIARGKKYDNIKIGNSTVMHDEIVKAKELICATIDLLVLKNEGNKPKREIFDNDRDRRQILKKLAAQLQIDPYFVSRGKKDENPESDEILEEFISQVAEKCT